MVNICAFKLKLSIILLTGKLKSSPKNRLLTKILYLFYKKVYFTIHKLPFTLHNLYQFNIKNQLFTS